MTEFANFITDGEMPDGYSSRGGQVTNPYIRTKTPSGSSSGSAVVVAAGLCTVSIGTGTAGSIISPSGQNGIVGFKPTIGLVGRSGIIPINNTFDTAGPMKKNVTDSAILLTILSETDPSDISTHSKKSTFIDYTQYLDKDGLKGLRIGICRNKDSREERKNAFNNLLNIMSNAGTILIDGINLDFEFNMWKINKNEFESSMNYYLSTLNGSINPKSLKDIMDYNEENSLKALKYGQKTFYFVTNKSTGTFTDPEYIEELINREKNHISHIVDFYRSVIAVNDMLNCFGIESNLRKLMITTYFDTYQGVNDLFLEDENKISDLAEFILGSYDDEERIQEAKQNGEISEYLGYLIKLREIQNQMNPKERVMFLFK